MIETLIYAICIILALIGLVALIYDIVMHFILKNSGVKCVIVIEFSNEGREFAFAFKNMVKSYPLFPYKHIDILLDKKDNDITMPIEKSDQKKV